MQLVSSSTQYSGYTLDCGKRKQGMHKGMSAQKLFVSNHLDWNQETCLAMLPTEFHVEDESSL